MKMERSKTRFNAKNESESGTVLWKISITSAKLSYHWFSFPLSKTLTISCKVSVLSLYLFSLSNHSAISRSIRVLNQVYTSNKRHWKIRNSLRNWREKKKDEEIGRIIKEMTVKSEIGERVRGDVEIEKERDTLSTPTLGLFLPFSFLLFSCPKQKKLINHHFPHTSTNN